MDKKAFLAVGLSLLIWMVWQKYYLEPIQQQQAAIQQQQAEKDQSKKNSEIKSDAAVSGLQAGKTTPALQVALPAKTLSIETESSSIRVSNEPAAVVNWELKRFSRTLEKKEEKVTLDQATGFGKQFRIRFSDSVYSPIEAINWTVLEKASPLSARTGLSSSEVNINRVITLDENGYGGKIEYSFQFHREPPKFVFLDLFGSPKRENDHEGSIFGQAPDKVHVTFRDLNGRHSHIGASIHENLESAAGVKWLGLDTRYFVLALVPNADSGYGAQVVNENNDFLGAQAVRGSLVFPTEGKREFAFSTKLYFGPKDMESLSKVDPILSDAIDFGWTSVIAIPMLKALKWLYSFMGNYGLAIITLTFLIKMMLFPLMYKSMKSMSKMSKLQPQLNALREKYKDDKEKLNVEMMNFMKANGYNPVGGCLPILLQMPIFFALYRVLFNSMELYQAPFIGWIHDLSSPDPFFVTPILLTGLMYLQQKLSPTTTMDPAQQKMLQLMPVMFGAFMLMLPSGLTIYMVVNSVVSIAQQWFLNKKLGIVPGAAQATAAPAKA